MKKIISIILVLVLTALTFVGCSSSTSGEVNVDDFFEKPLTFIVHAAAGGNLDIKVRMVAKYLEEEIGQTIVVENLPGAGGVTAATTYLQEKSNSRKIIVMGDQMFSIAPHTNEIEYTMEDFAPIIGLDVVKAGLFVNPDKFSTFEDYVNYGKENTLIIGAGGKASGGYMAQAILNDELGLEYQDVTNKSAAESLTSVYAGHTDACWSSMALASQYVDEGSLIPLLTFSPEDYIYDSGLEVPSARTLGVDMEHQNFIYFAMRSGSDLSLIEELNQSISNVYSNDEFLNEISKIGVSLHPLNGEETTEYVNESTRIINEFYENNK